MSKDELEDDYEYLNNFFERNDDKPELFGHSHRVDSEGVGEEMRVTRDAIGAREGASATGGDVGAPVVGPTEGAGEGVEQGQGSQAERVAGARVQPWTCLAMGQGTEEAGPSTIRSVSRKGHKRKKATKSVGIQQSQGKLEKAYSMIKHMPFEPDAYVWVALLSSCRVHSNVTIGEVVARKLFKLEPRNLGNYILLSNIYASKGK
ncbi:hypothetical protein CJ030_MR3G009528 [Morella rubra]|uniref:Pentatricopeptide repeat-containing protein n=1 Tax=Morella rubra TaxID=262757 RepID=A0A6A1W6D8_9ROSI|nr:hypothetical protein CJ030_MR3G009528 [Morella rubra]